MPVRFENVMTGRVVEYATPEEIAPPERRYASKEDKAQAEYAANQRRRLLSRLIRSRRWRPTDKPVTRKTLRQLEHERREAERRRIEAQLRAEFEQRLEDEIAKRDLQQPAAAPEPSAVETSTQERPRATTAEIRAWAREQGMDVPRTGTLPSDVVDAYHQAHAG